MEATGNQNANVIETPNNRLLQPALEQIGTGECPVCKNDVAIYVTKTNRPFLNCGFCSARVFYNGRESIQRLLQRMNPVGPTNHQSQHHAQQSDSGGKEELI